MKLLGLVFIFSGILAIALSGLEVVLVFTGSSGNTQMLNYNYTYFTPSFIWGIIDYTFGFGLVFFICGLGIFFTKMVLQSQIHKKIEKLVN